MPSRGLIRRYFDAVYNPLYDAGTGRLIRYRQAQQRVAALLKAESGSTVLCVGLGTGNELATLRASARDLHIVGVDFSSSALARARRKSSFAPHTSLLLMEAQQLGFRNESFDRVLAYHLTDFLPSPATATGEILRVLKPGGRFVVSFPSNSEGFGLGVSLFRRGVAVDDSSVHGAAAGSFIAAMLAGSAYLPLLLRRRPNPLSEEELRRLLHPLGVRHYNIEHDAVYRDHIVSGIKQ